jgi:MIO-dependent L-tyrosine 2,3-aminomutase
MGPVLIGLESQDTDPIADLVAVARAGREAVVSDAAQRRIEKAYRRVEQWAREGRVVYGMTTALGDNVRALIPASEATQHSMHVIRTHAAGTGPCLSDDVVRAIMFQRLVCFSRGYSGVSPDVVLTLERMLQLGIYPRVPEQGSVGASGDLAPLAHIGLGVIGEGLVSYRGAVVEAAQAFRDAGVGPVSRLTLKDGLSLINGTTAMTALAALLCHDSRVLFGNALIATALSIEAIGGSATPFGKDGNDLRPHPGGVSVSARLHTLLTSGGAMVASEQSITKALEAEIDDRDVRLGSRQRQLAYSLRCIPAILGAVDDTLRHVESVVRTELKSVDDNPLVLDNGEPFHGSHFHGQHVAMVMDSLANALCVIGIAAERRAARLLDRTKNEGLPPFLTPGTPGLDYGFQGPQFTCTALVSESRSLAYPASIGSISTNADFQDVVSMGLIAARKAAQIYRNILRVVGFELLCGAQAIELRAAQGAQGAQPSRAAAAAVAAVREHVPSLSQDRSFTEDFDRVAALVETGAIIGAVDAALAA